MDRTPLLVVDQLRKVYTRGVLKKQVIFDLEADFTIETPSIVGMMGPNGSGKTTLFELITGSNQPNSGNVYCHGHDTRLLPQCNTINKEMKNLNHNLEKTNIGWMDP